jgi:Tol biopolymer transport system component
LCCKWIDAWNEQESVTEVLSAQPTLLHSEDETMRCIQAAARPFLLLVLLAGIGFGLAACGRVGLPAPEEATGLAEEPLAKLALPTGSPQPQGEPGVEWSEPPDCRTQPLSGEGLARMRANPLDLQRAAMLTHADNPRLLLLSGEAQAALAGLALNVAGGRLNRATGLDLPNLPDVKTVGDLMDRLEAGLADPSAPAALVLAGQQVQAGQGIARAVCARLFVTQFDQPPGQVEWSADGVQAVPAQAESQSLAAPQPGLVLDGGQVAPDGRRAAFTSLGYETGGPIFLLDLPTGEWTDLIEALNARLPAGQPPLAADLWWEVIGWFPDSRRLMVGPADLSSVYVVDLETGAFQAYPFPGGGLGGSGFVHLAPDGSHFVFVANTDDGGQALTAFDLASGQTSALVTAAPEDGLLLYPRFSPDGSAIAYLVQKGHPTTGQTYTIDLYAPQEQAVRTLVEGNLGPTVPAWSPDGQRIAFSRLEPGEPSLVVPEQPPPPMRGNIWVVPAAGGTPQQVTRIDGWARSPAWDFDSRTLAFVTHDGQVGLVDIGHPGRAWRAAETTTGSPLMTSAFFVP